jgi:putative ABC transport system ATP-binding protein
MSRIKFNINNSRNHVNTTSIKKTCGGFLLMPLLELVNVSKVYGSGEGALCALSDINITVKRGEFLAITGTSGSGKSTLMNLLGLLDTQTSGEYRFDGTPVAALPERRLCSIRNREIGFIFQSFNLIPTLSAEENVELPLVYRKVPANERKRIAAEALKSVCVYHRRSHKPSEMSGGQQQRVAIARAIAARPMLILADEPTGNLDSASGNDVMNILRDLNAAGTTVIIITHDPAIAASADRVVQIRDGRQTE